MRRVQPPSASMRDSRSSATPCTTWRMSPCTLACSPQKLVTPGGRAHAAEKAVALDQERRAPRSRGGHRGRDAGRPAAEHHHFVFAQHRGLPAGFGHDCLHGSQWNRSVRIDAVVHPLQPGESGRFRAALEQPVAQLALHAAGVVDVAVEPGRELHPAGAQVAGLLVFSERRPGLPAVERSAAPSTTASSIAWPAPWARYCSMGWAASPSSVTRPVAPVLHRLAVAQHPHLPGLDLAQQLAHLRHGLRKALVELRRCRRRCSSLRRTCCCGTRPPG